MASLLCFCAWGCCIWVTPCLLLPCYSALIVAVLIALCSLSLLVNLFPFCWQVYRPSWCQDGQCSKGSNIWYCFQLKVGTFCLLHKDKWILPSPPRILSPFELCPHHQLLFLCCVSSYNCLLSSKFSAAVLTNWVQEKPHHPAEKARQKLDRQGCSWMLVGKMLGSLQAP